jgi:ABC-type transporter Mla subunit MlaD
MRVENAKLKVGVIVLFSAVCLAVFAFLYTQAGGRWRLDSPYSVTTIMPEPLNLVENSDVRIGGVKVGRVIQRGQTESGVGTVTFELEDESVAPIYQDARVTPRIKTLVGETYIDLDPGNPDAGEIEDGGQLPASQSNEVAALEEILSTFRAPTRRHVTRNLRSLGVSFNDHGEDLNRLFAASETLVADGGRLMQVLRGQRQQLAYALNDVARVMQTFADRTESVRVLATQAKAAAEAASQQNAELESTFTELPPTLRTARSTLDKLGAFSDNATPVLRDLRVASNDLAPAVRDLKPAAQDANRIFDILPRFIDEADPMFAALAPFSKNLDPAIDSLDSVLREAIPMVAYLEDYDEEFGAFFANTGSINDYPDALGQLGRVHAVANPVGPDLATNNKAMVDAYNALIDGGLLENYTSKQLSNHYPKPGTIGDSTTESNYKPITAP